MPTTNNQISGRGIQTYVTFVQKPQAAVNQAKSFNWQQFSYEAYSTYSLSKKRDTKIHSYMQSRRVHYGIKENNANLALEKVFPTVEIHEKVESSLEESKWVVHDKLLEILPPMRDIQHYGIFILHDFEDLFMRKKSTIDESFNSSSSYHLLSVSVHNMFCKICQVSSPIIL